MSTDSDDTIDWARSVAGDGEAFGRIFDRHHERVLRHSSRLVPHQADVDDVLAVTFLEAWRSRDRVRIVDGSVLPWLLVTANHVASNIRRGARRHQALLHRLPPAEPAGDHALEITDTPATQALRKLTQTDQQVVMLCLLEGFTTREAANVLDVPEGTVKSRLSRARRRLAQQLSQPFTPSSLAPGEAR